MGMQERKYDIAQIWWITSVVVIIISKMTSINQNLIIYESFFTLSVHRSISIEIPIVIMGCECEGLQQRVSCSLK